MKAAARAGILVALALVVACSREPTGPNEHTWRLLPGQVQVFSFAPFRNGRQCWVYLPPGYSYSNRRYPVLYANDGGGVLGGGIHADRICEDLIRAGEMDPVIIVAISTFPDTTRFWEYAPWPEFYGGQTLGGGGDAYVRALRDTLKPEIDRRFRTLSDRAHTAITGYSLGGLISAYAATAYDSTFGLVGACSPTYGWGVPRGIYGVVDGRVRSQLPLKYYQDTGYPHDNDISSMEAELLYLGYKEGIDLMSITTKDATHSFDAWEHRFPGMLRFLFPPGSD